MNAWKKKLGEAERRMCKGAGEKIECMEKEARRKTERMMHKGAGGKIE